MTDRRDPATPPIDGPGRPIAFARIPRASLSRRKMGIASAAAAGALGLGWVVLRTLASARSWLHDRPEFAVDFDRIVLDPPPPEAYKPGAPGLLKAVRGRAKLDGTIRVLDQDLEELGRAFAKHSPWVEHVERVERAYPDRIVVRLAYRVPVAKIEMGGSRFVAISEDGAMLPGEDVAPSVASGLVKLWGYPHAMALRPGLFLGAEATGQVPHDVAAVVALLRLLHDRQSGGEPRIEGLEMAAAPILRARLRGGLWVVWGRGPGDEVEGEPRAAEKLERLAKSEDVLRGEKIASGSYLVFTREGIERRPMPATEASPTKKPRG